LDLAGNVWEWCQDEPAGRLASALGLKEAGSGRVLRGGGFGDEPQSLRVSDRIDWRPSGRNVLFGFRCVSWCVAGPSVPDP
jgi:formylglycine-generating enzyme required for sulfatase activity